MIEIGDDVGSYRVIEILDFDIIGYCEGNLQPYVLWRSDIVDDVQNAVFFRTYDDAKDEVIRRHRYDGMDIEDLRKMAL